MTRTELSENHRRSISITLQLVDQALCEWDDWANGQVHQGIIYQQVDTLSPTQKHRLHEKIHEIRDRLLRLRHDLDLEVKKVMTSRSIMSHSALLWEMLAELNSHSLQAYGKVSDQLAHYIDPVGERLATEMNEITRLFSKPSSVISS